MGNSGRIIGKSKSMIGSGLTITVDQDFLHTNAIANMLKHAVEQVDGIMSAVSSDLK